MAHRTLFKFAFLLYLCLGSINAFAATAVSTGKIDAERSKLLSWLSNLPYEHPRRVISGQYGYNDAALTASRCSHWPALLELPFWLPNDSTWNSWPMAKSRRRILKQYWDAGGLVSVHMPIPNPKNESNQHDKDMTGKQFASVSIDGTKINRQYREWLDKLSVQLAWLQNQGVIVLIRPLHEANGKWFWYGNRSPSAFKRLFRYTVNYLRNRKHLHNLIIVFSTNIGRNLTLYYPGDAYVDIVGIDSYKRHPLALHKELAKLKRLGKPIMVSEAGWSARNNTPKFSQDDYSDIALTIKREPSLIGWSSWRKTNSPANQLQCKQLYDDPMIMDRSEVNWRQP